MKVYFFSFISDTSILYDTFRYCQKKNIDCSFFVSKYIAKKEKNLVSYGYIVWFIHRVVSKLMKHIGVPYFWIRFYQEFFYDLYFLFHIKEPTIIVTTNGWIPMIVKKNKKIGGKLIVYSGNPCDFKISEVIEEHRYVSPSLKDVYNFKPRMKKYEKTVFESDYIVAFNRLTYHSFEGFVNIDKVVLFQSVFNINENYWSQNKNNPKPNILTFSYLAHTILLKGLQVLLQAWEEASLSNARLIIGGGIQNELQSYFINQIGRMQNVIWIGPVDSRDVGRFLHDSHVYICPSIIDAGPRTITESMSLKIPVIASENCGISYIINHGKSGYVYKNNDYRELATYISWFEENQDQIQIMGNIAYDTVFEELNKRDGFHENVLNLIKSLR